MGKIYKVRHAWTLKKLVRRVKEFTPATTMEECYNGLNVFKILAIGPITEQRNLTFDQLSTVRNLKKWVNLKLASFGKPNEKESVL